MKPQQSEFKSLFPEITNKTFSLIKPIHFILGTGRSGTTLLRVMLAGHPHIFCPPEMMLAFFNTMQQRKILLENAFWLKGGLRRALMNLQNLTVEEAKVSVEEMNDKSIEEVYNYLQNLCGNKTIIDKCPAISYLPESLKKIPNRFNNAKFIWIIRHPGSVIRSFENMPMAEVMLKGLPNINSAEDAWKIGNKNVRNFLEKQPENNWLMLRYEDLVREPEKSIKPVLEMLNLPFDSSVLNPYQGDRMREGPAGARAIGDPNMANRGKIDESLADSWLNGFDPRSVSNETKELAFTLDYNLDKMNLPPIAEVSGAINKLLNTACNLESKIRVPMDIDALEGRRFLLRMLSESIDTFVEYLDPDHPVFRHAEGPHRKMFGDCPDANYLTAPIILENKRTYKIWGVIPSETTYIGIVLYGKGGRVSSKLADSEIKVDQNGRFEIKVSSDTTINPELLGVGDELSVMVRQYFSNREKEKPIQVHIKLLGDTPEPKLIEPETMTRQLRLATSMLNAIFSRSIEAYESVRTAALNRFIEIPPDKLFPTPDNQYKVCWYRFGRDQILFVRGQLPKARYFSFTLYNSWLESFDYTKHQINLNHSQIKTDKTGNFEICLSHKNPNHPNWLDTAGHHAGCLLARSLLAEENLKELSIQVMYIKEWEKSKITE